MSLVVLGVAVALVVTTFGGGGSKGLTQGKAASVARTASLPAAEAGLLPWQLPDPISRAVAVPGSGTQIRILGGLTSSDASQANVLALDTSDGAVTALGNLPSPVHDGSGAHIGNRDIVFGGGSPATVSTVQAFDSSSAGATPDSRVIGALPSPRSDSASVTIGRTAYVVGGYDGENATAEVVSTTNGASYSDVAPLAVPVRYPAVSSLGGDIFVFGGEALSGAAAGAPIDTIQEIDPRAKRSWVVGHLPEPLEAASAFLIGKEIFVAGGDSSTPQTSVPGVGSTQLSPPGPGSNRGAGVNGAITDSYVHREMGSSQPRPNARVRGAKGFNSREEPTTSAAATTGAATTTAATTTAATTSSVSTIWAWDGTSRRLLVAGRLQVPVSHAAVAVSGSRAWLVGGETSGAVQGIVQVIAPNATFGTAGASGAGSPYYGSKLLVADRGNNRLILMDPSMHIDWQFPSATSPPDPLGFYFPDDAFFTNKGRAIISNQEENETIVEIAYPSGKVIWSYGHPKRTGSAAGFLHEPDDAYLLKNGQVTVADAENCRVLVINSDGSLARQIGKTGVCVHNPPTSMGSPNGDTPLADGNLLVSEINGSWVSEYTTTGALVWTLHLPISYPSDPQQIGPDLYLIADYARPGQVLEFNREGTISYRYDVPSGPGMLDHPSLAELLPNGVIMANDDYRNRMVAIDPSTDALVWQYGINDAAGSSPGMLDTPDGFDILTPTGSTPTHQATG